VPSESPNHSQSSSSPVDLRIERLDLESEAHREACQAFKLSGDFAYVAKWVNEWVWQNDPEPLPSGTLLGFDRESGTLAGFLAWRLRRESVRGQKEIVGEIWFLAVAEDYQHRACTAGHNVATMLFVTAEAVMREEEMTEDDMPLTIEVDVDNEARDVYVDGWGFEHWKWKDGLGGEHVAERLWRPATEQDEPAPDEPAQDA
jgi:ribosomal protein S18 acetylase RimI-like enzyme